MDPLIQDTLLDLWMHILGIILSGGVVIAVVWWFRHRGTNHRNPLFAKAVLQEMTLERVSRVIDIGCGTGWVSREVARTATDGDVVGIDISERAVRKVQGLISVEAQPWQLPGDHIAGSQCHRVTDGAKVLYAGSPKKRVAFRRIYL